ncbi:hypothetical protein M5689_012968 [Euphorbia peplus]|nr:hypothetical protein M5689_012968 [Euphorbia peplus]
MLNYSDKCWDFINPRNISQIYSYDLLLIDNQGDTIHAIISIDVADKQRDVLLEGNVYYISGFTVAAAQANYHVRIILIEDLSGTEIETTLWDNITLAFPEPHVVSCSEDKPVALAIVAVVARPFNDGFTLTSTAGTKMFVNPAIPEITIFLGRVTKPYPFLHMIAKLLDDNTNIEDERNTNRKSVVELLQVDIHTDKEIKFTCKGKIKAIECEEGWWYCACPRCKSSIQNLNDKLWCKNCRFIEALPITWYRLRLIVEDNTGSATFVLFGRMEADFIGVPAHTLAASFRDRD